MVGKNVSNRVTGPYLQEKPCQTVSGRESTSPPATPIRTLAKACQTCQTVSNRVKTCNRTLVAGKTVGKTVSNRVGERVGKLSFSSLQNRVKPCHRTLYHTRSPSHSLQKVCQAVSIREVGKLRPVAKPCQIRTLLHEKTCQPCWGGVCNATASAANYMP